MELQQFGAPTNEVNRQKSRYVRNEDPFESNEGADPDGHTKLDDESQYSQV